MREQLQALLVDLNGYIAYGDTVGIGWVKTRIAAILAANPEPVVKVKPGWVCKDGVGLKWCCKRPEWFDSNRWGTEYARDEQYIDDAITDPWPNHPNGGPECWREVQP